MSLRALFACVTEPTRELLDQSARLLMSLRWFGGAVADAPFVVACTGPLPERAAALFAHFDAMVVPMAPYPGAHGPSNKVALLGLPALSGYDVVVLMDCDTLIVQDPSAWLDGEGLAAKIADLPTVTTPELEGVFRHFGVPMPEARFRHELTGDPCIAYCNSGVLVVREEQRVELAAEWDRWNQAVLALPETVRFNRYHADQLSLALAIESSGIALRELPAEMNLPAHLTSYPEEWKRLDPVVVHYHWLAYSSGFLKPNALAQCSRRIESFNARLRAEGLAQWGRGGNASSVVPAAPPDGASSTLPAAPPDGASSALPAAPPDGASRPKVVVGSGWWCNDAASPWMLGSARTRSLEFFELWYRQVVRCLRPHRIVVTDSASPIKPDHASFPGLEWIELDQNYGHANDIRVGRIQTKYSGFTRSVITGATYALCCDADFYVYVEQDCLLFGDELLAHALGDSQGDIFLGAAAENAKGLGGAPAAPMLQQSLMVVRRSGLERFLQGLLGAPWTDGECSPEEIMRRRLAPFDLLRIPYGRSRPIDFARAHFYAQHLEQEELERFAARAGAELRLEELAFDVGRLAAKPRS